MTKVSTNAKDARPLSTTKARFAGRSVATTARSTAFPWGECCDSDHEDGNHEEVKYECDNCGHKFIDEEDWSGRCDESSCHYCESEDEEQDELNAAIDASGNALY